MVFIISDESDQVEKESTQDQLPDNFTTNEEPGLISQLGKSAVKSIAIPSSRVIEKVSKAPGSIIELPSTIVQGLYSAMGKEPPEWTQGPVSFRLTEGGEIRPLLATPEEAREMYTKPSIGEYTEPTNYAEEVLSSAGDVLGDLLTSGVNKPRQLLKGSAIATAVRKGSEFEGIPPFFSIPSEALLTHAVTTKPSRSQIESSTTKMGSDLS